MFAKISSILSDSRSNENSLPNASVNLSFGNEHSYLPLKNPFLRDFIIEKKTASDKSQHFFRFAL